MYSKCSAFIFATLVAALSVLMHGDFARAVEPTHVDFRARAQAEEVTIAELRALFADHAATSTLGQPGNRIGIGPHVIKINYALTSFEGRKLSSGTTDALTDMYFKYVQSPHEVTLFKTIPSILKKQADEGWLTEATLSRILEKTPDGRLSDVVYAALKKKPALRTVALDARILQAFANVVTEAPSSLELNKAIMELVDAGTVRANPKLVERLREFALDPSSGGVYRIMVGNPKLVSLLGADLEVPSPGAIVAMSDERAESERTLYGLTTDTESVDFDKHNKAVESKVRQAALESSRQRIHQIFTVPENLLAGGLKETEISRALELLSKPLTEAQQEVFLKDLMVLSSEPTLSDKVRTSAMRALHNSFSTQPGVRQVILESAALLKAVPPGFIVSLADWTKGAALTGSERAALQKFLEREAVPKDASVKSSLVQLRRQSLQAVTGVEAGACAAIFRTLGPK